MSSKGYVIGIISRRVVMYIESYEINSTARSMIECVPYITWKEEEISQNDE